VATVIEGVGAPEVQKVRGIDVVTGRSHGDLLRNKAIWEGLGARVWSGET
jgi:hypothetical protein